MAMGTYKTWANISMHTVLSKKMIHLSNTGMQKNDCTFIFLTIAPIGMQIQDEDFRTIKFESTRYKVPYEA